MPDRLATGSEGLLSLREIDGASLFEIDELVGKEMASELFEFSLRLRIPSSVNNPARSLSGQEAKIVWRLAGGAERVIMGMFRRFTRMTADARFDHYSGIFVPKVWRATLQRRCRVYQDRTAPEIIAEVLRPYGVEAHLRRQNYDRRNTCIQYLESDFSFARRLMEEEGIHFYFDHARDSILVISDDSTFNPMLPEPSRLRYSEVSGQTDTNGRIYSLEVRQQMSIPDVRLRDHGFQRREPRIDVSTPTFASGRGGIAPANWKGFVADYGSVAHRLDEYSANGERRAEVPDGVDESERMAARLHAELHAANFERTTGASDYLHLAPGFRFELADGGAADDGVYWMTKLEHSYRQTESKQWEWHNCFECIRAEFPFRPARAAPKPKIRGVQSAIVAGASGAAPLTDRYGRVQIRFRWQENENACWTRVGQAWAGDGFGALFTPRPGQEVAIGFAGGDPDQPLIVGGLYNSANTPAYELPAGASISGFTSRSSGRGATPGDSSHLYFVDAPGKEQLHLHSQRHAHLSAEHSFIQLVGWGSAESNDKSYLTSPISLTPLNLADAVKSKVFGADDWKAGWVQKIKGVQHHSVWGSQMEATLGTASEFIVGGWSQAHVGFITGMDVGFRTDVSLGLKVDLNVAPRFYVNVGNQFDHVNGTRFVKCGGDYLADVGGDCIEKFGGSRLIMSGGRVGQRLMRESSGISQTFDVSAFKVQAGRPSQGTEEFERLQDARIAHWRAETSKKLQGADPGMVNLYKGMYRDDLFPLLEDPDSVLKKTGAFLQSLREKYAIELVAESGDVVIGSMGRSLTLFADTIDIVGDSIRILAPKKSLYDELNPKPAIDTLEIDVANQGGDGPPVMNESGAKPTYGDTHKMMGDASLVAAAGRFSLEYEGAKTKLKSARDVVAISSMLSAPPLTLVGFALVSSIVAAASWDSNFKL